MFTLADVEAAVEATGLTPHSGDFLSETGCLCPASILVVAKHGEKAIQALRGALEEGDIVSHVIEQLIDFGVFEGELDCFTGGVDGTDEDSLDFYFDYENGSACKKAYELGQAVRKRYSLT